jgi:ketosteroid isomerase-like protein
MLNNRISKLLAAALLALLASIPALAADTKADMAALEAVDQAWLKAFNSGNADAIAALYDENAVLLPPNAPAAVGRAAIKAFLKAEMDGAAKAGVAFALGAKPAGGATGNMGWQSGSYTVKDKAGKVLEAGKYLSVSAKKNGKWVYVRDTWNADAAPPPAPAPAAPAPAAAPKK